MQAQCRMAVIGSILPLCRPPDPSSPCRIIDDILVVGVVHAHLRLLHRLVEVIVDVCLQKQNRNSCILIDTLFFVWFRFEQLTERNRLLYCSIHSTTWCNLTPPRLCGNQRAGEEMC